MKYEAPFFSIIMPVFNGGEYLETAIHSILNQTYDNFEFLILDDSSSDNTFNIISKFEISDKRIKKFKNKVNIGLTKSLNKLIPYCRGEFIVRLDADDYCTENRLTNFLKYYNANKETKIYSTPAYTTDSYLNIKKKIPNIITRNFFNQSILDYKNCLIAGTLIIHSSILKAYKYNPEYKYSQDFELYHKVISNGYKICYDKFNCSYLLRQHNNQISSKKKSRQLFFFEKALGEYSNLKISNPLRRRILSYIHQFFLILNFEKNSN